MDGAVAVLKLSICADDSETCAKANRLQWRGDYGDCVEIGDSLFFTDLHFNRRQSLNQAISQ